MLGLEICSHKCNANEVYQRMLNIHWSSWQFKFLVTAVKISYSNYKDKIRLQFWDEFTLV